MDDFDAMLIWEEKKVSINNENIIITDPCYIEGVEPLISETTIEGDWSCFVYRGTHREASGPIEEWNEYYDIFFHQYYLEKDPNCDLKALWDAHLDFKKGFKDKYTLGEFCADGAMVGVFLSKDIDPENLNFLLEKPLATEIKNFTGEVRYVIEDTLEGREVHVIGTGNINFYTAQYA